MSGQSTFEIYINGTRNGVPLSPATFDINEWIDTLRHGSNLLFPDTSPKSRPFVSVNTQPGSIRFLLTTTAAAIIQVQALLGAVKDNGELGILSKKQAEAVQFFHKMAQEKQFDIQLGKQGALQEGLHLDRNTEFQPDEPAWVEVETFVWGKVVNLGGKTNPNIHLETEDFGTLIISATEAELADQEKNRIYQQQQLQVRIKQNAFTGEYDNKSAQFVAFVDNDLSESGDAYLDRLIKAATPDWLEVKDPEVWLREIRGYED